MLFDFRKRKMLRRDFHRHLSIKNDVIQTDVHAIGKTDENQSSKIGPFTERCSKNRNFTCFFLHICKIPFLVYKKKEPLLWKPIYKTQIESLQNWYYEDWECKFHEEGKMS